MFVIQLGLYVCVFAIVWMDFSVVIAMIRVISMT